jgi:squalene synthase HpnC
VENAYGWCLELAGRHYENFPVASRLLPPRLRRPVAVIYAFARIADDYADEGGSVEARLAQLAAWERALLACDRGEPASHPVFTALADVRARFDLPLPLFRDLIDAFRQDVTKQRYADFGEVRDYCRHSADPVGRLLLHLNGDATPENLALSDQICTALQLINFWQDLDQDLTENDRIYLPRDEMARFGVTEALLRARRPSEPLRNLMAFQYQRARALMLAGAPLARRVRGRLGWELRLIVAGGLTVLDRLAAAEPFARPRLRLRDTGPLLWRALKIPS